jgi:prepilin-type processing-associated H-X9-DG protein
MLPAVQKVREAADRIKSANNLKMLGLAMHKYEDVHGHFPPAVVYGRDGKTPLYSWRVELLPYLEEQALYDQFKKDEPWNGPNNVKLLPLMPKVFALPAAPDDTKTPYQVFVTPVPRGAPVPPDAAPFGGSQPPRVAAIRDGLSNTLMIAEAATSVPWTQPVDLTFDPKGPLPRLGPPTGTPTFNVLFFDGSVRALKRDLKPETLKALITHQGGEVVELDP